MSRRQLAILADERLRQALCVIREIERVSALDAKKIAIDPTLIAVIAAHNLHAPVSDRRTPSVVLHPSPQWVQTVPTWFISHGRVL